MSLPAVYNTINLKPKPTITVMGEFSAPLQAAVRHANELLPEFYKAVLRYNDHVADINDSPDKVKPRNCNFGVYRNVHRD